MIHEVLTSMMLEDYLSKFPERQTDLEALQVNCQSKELECEEWNTAKEHTYTIEAAFQVKGSIVPIFKLYVTDLFPILGLPSDDHHYCPKLV